MHLKKKGLSEEFWLCGEGELEKILCKYWFEIHTKNGKQYRMESSENLRYLLNTVLHKKGHEFDIIHSDSFTKSRQAFKNACTELISICKGIRIPYKEIRPKGEYLKIQFIKKRFITLLENIQCKNTGFNKTETFQFNQYSSPSQFLPDFFLKNYLLNFLHIL